MSTVYRQKYNGRYGVYEILFFEASAEPLVGLDYVDLPENAMRPQKFLYDFDKYPIGMPKAPEITLDVDLNALPDDACRDLFVEPVRELPLNIAGANYGTFRAGTVFIVSLPGLPEFFIGCLRQELSVSVNLGGVLSCTLDHIGRCILDSTNYNAYATNATPVTARSGAREAYIDISGELWSLHSENKNFNIRFDSFNSTFVYPLFDIVNAAYKAIMRDASRQFNTGFPKAKFYKQNSTNYQLPGDLLTQADLNVIRQATSKPDSSGHGGNEVVGGVMADLRDGAPDKYDCFWDFYADLAEFFLSVAVIRPNGIFFQAPYGPYPGAAALPSFTIERDAIITSEPEVVLFTDVLKTATGSVVERIDDGSGFSDQDKHEARSVASRNEGEYTVPIMFQTSPVCQKYSAVKGFPNDFVGKFVHIWGLYYYYSVDGGQALEKVCHTVDYYLDSTRTIPRDNVTIDVTKFKRAQGGELTALVQLVSGAHKHAAEAMLKLFGDTSQCSFEPELSFADGFFALERLGEMFEVTLSGSDGYIGQKLQAKTWSVIKTEFDFNKETIKLTLLSRGL